MPLTFQMLKDLGGDTVIHDPLFGNGAPLLGIERGRIIFEILDQQSRVLGGVKDLGLAFVYFLQLCSFYPRLFKNLVPITDIIFDVKAGINFIL